MPAGPVEVRYRPVFAVTAAGVALVNLDLFVVSVALPDMGSTFDAGLPALSWVLSGYAIVFAALLVPAGRIADRTGRRRAFLAGVAVFAAASGVCAAANTVELLVAARVVQAAGGALLVPSSLGLLLAAAPAERRAAVLPGMLLTGIGVGFALPTLVGAAVATVPPAQFATASAVVTMARQVGTVLGVALLVTLLGSPQTPAAVLAAFDRASDLMILSALLAGAVALLLTRTTSGAAAPTPRGMTAT